MNFARIKYFALLSVLVSMLVGINMSVYADDPPQEEAPKFRFSDEQLLSFFDANQEISTMQKDIQDRINATLEQKGFTPDRFRQIGTAAQIGALESGNFTAEEIASFNAVAPQVTAIQREQQGMMQALLSEKGLSTQVYQEIINEFRQSQDLQAHVRDLARERAIEAVREERRIQREAEAQDQSGSQQ
jgi:hypothetical protein